MINTLRTKPSQYVLLAVTLVVAWAASPALSESSLRDGDSVAIVGDSITQARKYSVLIEAYLLACGPVDSPQAMAHGWSGEQMSGLAKRVENDVLRFSPDVVTTSYGMNDGRYRAFDPAIAKTFRQNTLDVVQKLKKGGTREIIIGSPGRVDTAIFTRTKPASIYNDTLQKFGQIAREIAAQEGVHFADVNGTMAEAVKRAKTQFGQDFAFLGQDGFHPEWAGHMVMAYAYLKAMIGSHEVGRITMDFEDGNATASAGHTVLASEKGSVELESTRYPFCYFGKPDNPDGTLSAANLTPFNDELNRYILVVKNAPARSRVTWGDASQEFTSDELRNGINLAEEFMTENPFRDPFWKLVVAIRSKQTFEIHMIKTWVTDLPIIEGRLLPEGSGLSGQMSDAIAQQRQVKIDAAQTLLAPIRHRLTVQAVTATP